jgi:hypothetical protein
MLLIGNMPVTLSMGRAMAQVVSRGDPGSRPGQSTWDWDRFFSKFLRFSLSYHTTVALQTHIIWGIRNMLT